MDEKNLPRWKQSIKGALKEIINLLVHLFLQNKKGVNRRHSNHKSLFFCPFNTVIISFL